MFKSYSSRKDHVVVHSRPMSVTEAFYPRPVRRTTLPDGTTLAYIEDGAGDQTLIFIHGLSGNLLSWHKNFDALSKTHRCIALDLPGNGMSGNSPSGNYSLPYFANCLLHLIGSKSLRNVTLIGHSMGAQIAVLAALEAPAAIQKLVLIAPAGLETFNAWEQATAQATFFLMDFWQRPEDAMRGFYEQAFHRMPQASRRMLETCLQDYHRHGDAAYRKMLTQCISGMFQTPVHHQLGSVQQPTLIVFGDHDALIPNRVWHPQLSQKRLAASAVKRLPKGEYAIFPQSGHFVHWESAEQTNDAIATFVRSPS